MARTFKPGSYFAMEAGDTEDAEKRLRSFFGSCEVQARQPDVPFAMEFSLTVFETTSFILWYAGSDIDITIPLDRHFICVALQGQVSVETGDAAITLEKGSAGVIAPSPGYRFCWRGKTILAAIAIREADYRQSAAAILSGQEPARLGTSRKFDVLKSPGSAFSELVDLLLADRRSGHTSVTNGSVRLLFDRLVVYNLLRAMGDEFLKRVADKSGVLVPKHVKRAEDYIKAHYFEPLDNVMLARIVEVSPRSLYRGFLQFRGVTPSQYIQDLRLDAAHNLLLGSKGLRDIRKIAVSTGFKSYPAFWRSYVRKYGVPPSKARNSGDAV